ncbi:epoxyqueuosine reductase [Chloroflexota bacterium]
MKISHPTINIQNDWARNINSEIKDFTNRSTLNRFPSAEHESIFVEPLIGFASGADRLFTEYKTVISPEHLTPREAMANGNRKNPQNFEFLSVISWVLPINKKTRESNRPRKTTQSKLWAYTRWYGEIFNVALREHMVAFIIEKGYHAVAPALMPYFDDKKVNSNGRFSNWSERHIAYAAGLGTFGLSGGFITERGIAHRCGSIVTDMKISPTTRMAGSPFLNCLFYSNNGKCKACVGRCPAGAITVKGRDKAVCQSYLRNNLDALDKKYGVEYGGCGLCQVKVPCEFHNPTLE